jgi:hypothetical protein
LNRPSLLARFLTVASAPESKAEEGVEEEEDEGVIKEGKEVVIERRLE